MTSRNWKSLNEQLAPRMPSDANANAATPNGAQRSNEKFNGCYASGMTNYARASLRVGDAAICMDCRGSGRSGYGMCERCNGKGAVCPKCAGMRFVRLRVKGQEAWRSDVVRCPTCTEGNNVNEMAEVKAIRAYIALAESIEQ